MAGNFKLDYISDLHIDWFRRENHLPIPAIDHLVNTQYSDYDTNSHTLLIAGDISDDINETADYLFSCRQFYKNILFVDGNHDVFGKERELIEKTVDLNETLKVDSNIYYLSYRDFEFEEGVVIGCNGWYDFNFTEHLTDPEECEELWKNLPTRDVKSINFGNTNVKEIAKSQAKQLDHRIKYHAGKRITVVTHTPPHPMSVSWPKKAKDQFLFTLSGAFGSSEMTKVLNTHINNLNVWIHGHNHIRQNYDYKDVRIMSNPRGYPWEGSEKCYIKSVLI